MTKFFCSKAYAKYNFDILDRKNEFFFKNFAKNSQVYQTY